MHEEIIVPRGDSQIYPELLVRIMSMVRGYCFEVIYVASVSRMIRKKISSGALSHSSLVSSLSDKPCSSSLGFTASMQHSGQDNTIVSANKSIRFPISPVLLAYLFPQAAASDSIGHPIMDVQSIMSTQCQVASRLQNPAGISKTQN